MKESHTLALIVAYYLSNLAPEAGRKKTVDQKDMETYFKIAKFVLPKQIRATLPNAKAAGYFDSAGDGKYKLNAVGYNLVAHSMPRGKDTPGKVGRLRKTTTRRKAKTKPGRIKRK